LFFSFGVERERGDLRREALTYLIHALESEAEGI
jgi:hypothetical protein